MRNQSTRRMFLASVLGGLALPTSTTRARKKHRGPRRCPTFKADNLCPAGEVFSVKWERCLPRTGIVDGQTYFCKGHKHPWFLVGDDGTPSCCRRECTPTIVSTFPADGTEDGHGLCHNWKPKTCQTPVV